MASTPLRTCIFDLELGGLTLPGNARLNDGIENVLTLFPGLKTRLRQRAGSLSGGEKQMLALANALILSPRLLLLDEPSLGLAPPLVAEALGHIQDINRRSGATVLIVEQKVREVLKIAQRVYTSSVTARCLFQVRRMSFRMM